MKPLIKLQLDEGIPLDHKHIEKIENSIIHMLHGVDKIYECCFSHANRIEAEKSCADQIEPQILEKEFSKLLEIVEEKWVILKTPITTHSGHAFFK
jgi:hypothetical protein